LADDYDSFNTRYTAFETDLHNLNTNHTKKKGNASSNFDWVIHMGKLYGTIVDFNPEFGEKYTKEDFLKLDADGLSAVLRESGVLRWNPKLECATVVEIQKNETKNKEGETVVTPYVRFSFPFMTIGKLFNFGYDSTESLFAPVNEGPVTDGMYKGMYIYKYVENGKQLYAISRSIISPNSYMTLFKNLDEAIRGVDGHVSDDIIDKNSLLAFKQEGAGAIPRKVMLELEHSREGQVVSVLDIDVPNIRFYDLSASIRSLFSLTVEQFKDLFRDKDGKLMIPAMENLYTPEQVATLLYLLEGNNDILDNNDRFSVKGYGVNTMATVQIYVKNAKKVEGAINKILSASKRHFYIERTVPSKRPVGTLAWVKYLNHGGTDVSTTGLSVGEITTDTFIKLTLTQAIEHFRDTYGVQVYAMDSEGLKEFSKTNGLGFEDKVSSVRAFIYNGEIYINTSVAHMSDLYHEIAHLYLGVLKVLHPNAYRQLMDYYRVAPEKAEGKQTDEQKARQRAFDSFENKLGGIKDFYKGMARADLEEEAVAAMIGDSLMSDNRLALDGLDDARYQELMDNVARTVGLFTESENDNGLGFTKIMSELKSNTDRVKRRRQVSNYIKEQIANKNITEIC
ncbi:MAG: hypothetical protein LUD72_04800, partial [Bacteroidales bacterium]|nr:hypothetical protein [Bacteroidales bacterium]